MKPTNGHIDPETEIEDCGPKIGRGLLEETEIPAASQEGASSFDRIAALIGCVSGGPTDFSEQTGKKSRQLLARP